MDTAQILADLRAQRDRINDAITALEALTDTANPAAKSTKAPTPAAVKSVKTEKRVVSPEARQRMADAQKKRYSKARAAAKSAAAVAPVAVATAKEAPKKTASKKAKGGITAAGRKRLSEAVKARWAAKKAATA